MRTTIEKGSKVGTTATFSQHTVL